MNKFLSIIFLTFGSSVFAQQDSVVSVEISSNYERARIWVDSVETPFVTPAVLTNIKAGKHVIGLRYADVLNHSEYAAEEWIDVKAGAPNKFLIEFKPVSVTIVCNVEKTKLYLNDRLKGEGNDLVLERIIPGTYNLRLTQPFGLSAEKSVYFPPNRSDCPQECFVFGNLHVLSEEVEGATIYINGLKTERKVPALFNNLIIGEYTMAIEVKGDLYYKKVIVKANEENEVHINPKQDAIEAKKLELAEKAANKEKEKKEKASRETQDSLWIITEKLQAKQEKEREKELEKHAPKSKLSPYGGFNFGLNVSYTGTIAKSAAPVTLSLGAFYDLPILNLVYFQPEISFSQKKISPESGDGFHVFRLNYVYLLVLLKIQLKGGPYGLAGSGIGFRTFGKTFKELGPPDQMTESPTEDIPINFGVGYGLRHSISLDLFLMYDLKSSFHQNIQKRSLLVSAIIFEDE